MLPDRLEHTTLDQGGGTIGPLHKISPRAKLIAACAVLIAINVVQPSWHPVAAQVPISWWHVALALVVLTAVHCSGASWRYLGRRLLIFGVPLLLVALTIPLSHGSRGWEIMAGVITKGLISLTVVVVLLYTTPFEQLLRALRQCGVPRLLVAILAAMRRYLFVLAEELERMRRAQYARTFDCPRRLSPVTVRNGVRAVAMLFVRCSERAERVHAAMLARGFDGEIRTFEEWQ